MVMLLLLALAGAGTATPATADASADKPVAEKKICKRETRIGTLAGRQRTCHTAAEWREIADRARETWQELQGKQGSTHSVEPGGQLTPY